MLIHSSNYDGAWQVWHADQRLHVAGFGLEEEAIALEKALGALPVQVHLRWKPPAHDRSFALCQGCLLGCWFVELFSRGPIALDGCHPPLSSADVPNQLIPASSRVQPPQPATSPQHDLHPPLPPRRSSTTSQSSAAPRHHPRAAAASGRRTGRRSGPPGSASRRSRPGITWSWRSRPQRARAGPPRDPLGKQRSRREQHRHAGGGGSRGATGYPADSHQPPQVNCVEAIAKVDFRCRLNSRSSLSICSPPTKSVGNFQVPAVGLSQYFEVTRIEIVHVW